MPRVLCTLPNASDAINGVAFTLDRGQMVSEVVDQETAETFASIPGYQIVPETQSQDETNAPAKKASKPKGEADSAS